MTVWIPLSERPPTDADGDTHGCVLAWHIYQHVLVLHVKNVVNYGRYITHWMPTPAAPME